MHETESFHAFVGFLVSRGVPQTVAELCCLETSLSFKHFIDDWTLDESDPYLELVVAKLLDRSDYTACVVGQDMDFLARDIHRRSFARALSNWQSASVVVEDVGPAVVMTARNEGPLLLDWVAHHLLSGFQHIYIYTNDNDDGSQKLLQDLCDLGLITLFLNNTAGDLNPQIKAYEHSIHCVQKIRKHKWIMYLDADEFVVFDKKYCFDVRDLLIDVESKGGACVGSVSFNWMWMGSSDAILFEAAHVFDRFQHGKPQSAFVKSLIRIDKCYSMMLVHKPILLNEFIGVNSGLQIINMDGHDAAFCFEGGEVRHYWNKSFVEFLIKRGRGEDRGDWKREFDLFFEWDVEKVSSNYRPIAPLLKERSLSGARILRQVGSLREDENRIFERYIDLASAIARPLSVRSLYEKAFLRWQFMERIRYWERFSAEVGSCSRYLEMRFFSDV